MPYPETKTFWVEKTDEVAVGLRRYHSSPESGRTGSWDCAGGYHAALAYTGRAPVAWNIWPDGYRSLEQQPEADHADPRWPVQCAQCDFRFTELDRWQPWQEMIWRDPASGKEYVNHRSAPDWAPTLPPGATYDSWWLARRPAYTGPDGVAYTVVCPNGDTWQVDSRAANCTLPDDTAHKCWVRHGRPQDCHVTVDKDGLTCGAGAGSIQAGDYHGFLTKGVLSAG